MSSDRFVVDVEVLERVAQAMHSLHEKMAAAKRQIAAIDSADFGVPKVRDSTGDFVRHWTFQSGRLGEQLEQLAAAMDATVADYKSTEHTVQAGLERLTEGL